MIQLIKNFNLILKELDIETETLVARKLLNNTLTIAVAESCTGGLISSRLTDIPGSSAYIRENFITYSNDAKIKHLNVNPATLAEHGAVSELCALEMAEGLLTKTTADIALSTTGIAGPDGGSLEKPVGLMYIGVAHKYASRAKKVLLDSNQSRKNLKYLFSQEALDFLLEFVDEIYSDKNSKMRALNHDPSIVNKVDSAINLKIEEVTSKDIEDASEIIENSEVCQDSENQNTDEESDNDDTSVEDVSKDEDKKDRASDS